MKITIETNIPLYGNGIVSIDDQSVAILTPENMVIDVLREVLQEKEVDFTSWVTKDVLVNNTGRWYVYLPENMSRENCSLLVQPYNDSSESYIAVQGSYDELKNIKNSDPEYSDGDIILGNWSVARCYSSEYQFKAESYLILT